MSLQDQLTAASTREQYIAVLKVTLTELAIALCRLAHDEGLTLPFQIRFKDQSLLPWQSRVAELRIDAEKEWIKEPQALHLSLPILGTLTSADGRTVTLSTLEYAEQLEIT